jgi:gamma-glutamyltranspeptidase/glutathione hydrolase
MLEPYDFSLWTPHSPEYIHTFCEAARLAFADRSAHLGDPDFWSVPSGLLAPEYISSRAAQIEQGHASSTEQTAPGNPGKAESEQTTHFSVCDTYGNMAAVTYTLNSRYGCKLAVEGAGFLLNNQMDDFSASPGIPNLYGLIGGEANKIEPHKRMLSSMAPTLILKEDQPFMILGAPGGGKIITVVAQAIINLTRFNMTPLETVTQPRFHHQWIPDQIFLEEGAFDINVKQALIRYGHVIEERAPYSDLQLISIDSDGMMAPGSDPRSHGLAGGL